MTQDFAKRKKTRSNAKTSGAKKTAGRAKREPTPPWILLLTGAVFGSFVTFLAFLSNVGPSATPEAAAVKPSADNTQFKDAPPLVFEFIEMLKEQTVEVPDVTPAKRVNKNAGKAYFIQAGSFKNYKDADALRARLILKGMNTEIETTTNSAGTTWYRVVVGPYTSRSKFHGAISALANDNIETLPLTRKL